MDPSTVIIIIGLATLIIERGFSWAIKIKKSHCFGMDIEMKDDCPEKTAKS
jgi:hypothetical protein